MNGPLIDALGEAQAILRAATPAEPGEAALTRRLTRELDEAIARLSRAEAGGTNDLVSIVCHDLKDPLASIIMGVGFLRRTIPPDEEAARRIVEAISRSAERMSHVVADFHDLTLLDLGLLAVELLPCDVGVALRGAVASFEAQAREPRISLTLEVASEGAIALCDRARLLQIASKLIGNALKFSSPEGRVVVRVVAEDAHVRVSVSDTGRGIPAERLPTIFDHRSNARHVPRDGPGLGLAIARGLVELQRGEITVQSRVGEGSLFTFTLPRA